jgi:gliding motility-associated-like protein
MLMLDEEGTVKQSATYVGGMYAIDALHATEDEIIIAGRYFGSGNAFYGALNDELRFKYLIGTANTFVPKGLNVTTTGSIIETGISGGQIFYLKKHIPNRKSSMCDSLPVVLTKVNELVNTAPLAVNTTSLTLPPAISSYSIVDHPMYSLPVNCSAISNCSSIVLSGIDKVCNGTEVYTYKAIKNGTCTSAIKWFYNKAAIQKVASDDSTISLRFLAQGSFKIKVRLMSGCEVPLDDSVIVNVGSGIGVDLGVDRMLCENNKVRISAGPHFSSYQWQDGSTDSFYTATKPGVYYVKATNACGYQYRDTVNIVAYINTGFNIGNNISKCNNDSVTVTAPSGYTNYSWTPANSISDATKQQINAFPAYTTRYYVKAKDQYGCSVSDSVLITVNRSKSVNLGNDTSLCIGNSIKLNAGEGFTYYRWSTSESNKEIIVKTAGTYFVYATDNNNCTSADSIQLLNVHPNPVVYLGNDTVICRGTSYNLNVGVYSSYLWSDNTSGRSIKVLQPGEYFVKVTDDKGCINSDTLHVTGYNELPSSFLPDTIKLCENEPVELKTSDKFVSYKWSTGSNQPSIHVASAGNYWLEVTNANGCRNRDTTYAVLKECFRLLYFPTAFTPNNDGKNDLFRPKVYGNLEKFHIVIYNKLGQKVFETTEPSQGWNGTIKGVPQDTQIFIWTSDFLFTGPNQKVKVEKGTITLLR